MLAGGILWPDDINVAGFISYLRNSYANNSKHIRVFHKSELFC